jgi:hypothetical protein
MSDISNADDRDKELLKLCAKARNTRANVVIDRKVLTAMRGC